MEITFCGLPENDETQLLTYLERLVELGATSVQTYIHWNRIEREPGVFDWSYYDRLVDRIEQYGLKWVPFLIAGPWYVTPEWVRSEPETVSYRCLEHGRDSGILSLHSPNLPEYVRRLLLSCAKRYLDRGVLESILIGISGDYGEAIYPVLGNWPGKYHGHLGYWCAEEPAKNSFRTYLQGRYGSVDRLNEAWRTSFPAFRCIQPVLRAASPSARAWLDQSDWYRQEMLDWARLWLRIAGECFPGVEVYLCTGGDGTPQHGSDLTAQCKLAAACGAGVRITNEGSDYPTNFLLTRLVASAAKHYGCFVGFEPASAVDHRGVAARIYNAGSSGARQLFEYVSNVLDGGKPKEESWQQFLRYREFLSEGLPEVETAVFIPLEDFTLREVGTTGYFRNFAKKLRGYVDFDLVDARMLADGAQERYRFLFVVGAARLDAVTQARIEDWVERGGVLITNVLTLDGDYSDLSWRKLLGITERTERVCAVNSLDLRHSGLTPHLAAKHELLGLEGYTGLAETVLTLAGMRDLPEAAGLWVNRYGKGAVCVASIKVDYDPEESDSYSWFSAGAHFWAAVADALGEAYRLVPAAVPPASLENGTGVYATAFPDRVLYLNCTPEPERRGSILIPAYGLGARSRPQSNARIG